jgi:hypothetical protein
VALWRCPECDREFGRARQQHVCVPGRTVDEVFAPHPPAYREIYDKLLGVLGPVHEDAVGVGVILKSTRSFAEVRPKARSLEVWLRLDEPITHPRLARRVGRWSFFKFTDADQVDERILEWLARACDS